MVSMKPKRENKKAKSRVEVVRMRFPTGARSTVPGREEAKLTEKEICRKGNSTPEQMRLTADRNRENPMEEVAAAVLLVFLI
jgi:hypothetical protein